MTASAHLGSAEPPGFPRLSRTAVPLRPVIAATLAAAALAVATALPGGDTAHAEPDASTPSDSAAAVQACPDGGVPRADFPDTVSNTHEDSVACVAWYGIARGVKPGAFAPSARVRRDQLASFVARLLDTAGVALPEPRDQGFDDLDGNPHAARINQLAELDVVRGRTATAYAPGRAVRRDQMATFLVRAYEIAHGEQLAAPPSGFEDTRGNVHESNIDKAVAAGFARGTAAGTYRPADPVRRDQMGSFLARVMERAATDGHLVPRERIQPTLTNESGLHARGVGPAEAGMTLAEVEQQTGTRMEIEEFDTFRGHCYYARPQGVAAYTFMVFAPGEEPAVDPREGIIGMVVTGWDSPHTGTLAGVAPGDRPEAVEGAYGTGRLERRPHEYQPGGFYLDLHAAGGQHGIRFSVGGDGVVEYVHSGDAGAITAVEGCA